MLYIGACCLCFSKYCLQQERESSTILCLICLGASAVGRECVSEGRYLASSKMPKRTASAQRSLTKSESYLFTVCWQQLVIVINATGPPLRRGVLGDHLDSSKSTSASSTVSCQTSTNTVFGFWEEFARPATSLVVHKDSISANEENVTSLRHHPKVLKRSNKNLKWHFYDMNSIPFSWASLP